MTKISNFTDGKIFSPLINFTIPILLALFLQTMYGAIDLLIVGQFSTSADVSAIATGSQIMTSITAMISGLTMGITILIGQKLGEGNKKEAGDVVASGIYIFTILAIITTLIIILFSSSITSLMQAPKEAFNDTVSYLKICGIGSIFIVYYNVICGVFRGLGDSKTPLITVFIACIVNILFDLLFVGVFKMATSGAAYATILAQAISVILSLMIIKRNGIPFNFSRKNICINKTLSSQIIKFGAPISIQGLFVNFSFLVIMMIGNSMGVIASAGIGIAQKLVGFIMLIPLSFSQSVSAFVAQNYGAQKYHRAKKVLLYSIIASLCCGIIMFYFTFFHGNMLSQLFTKDEAVILASWNYLKSYGIDCIFTAIMFCMVGYFNGCGNTTFVMIQGIFGAFCVRIPFSYLMNKLDPTSLFKLGLSTPAATFVQIILCVLFFIFVSKKI